MKCPAHQLPKHFNPLLPLYWISGDEPLLVQEAADQVRTAAHIQGAEKIVLHIDARFDWEQLFAHTDNLSLFSSQQLIECRLTTTNLGTAGSKALVRYTDALPPDTTLLFISPKLDTQKQKTKWYKAIDAVGVHVALWPLNPSQFKTWLQHRLQTASLTLPPEGVALLMERTEGNLLAAHQAIEKLQLQYGNSAVELTQLHASLSDSARFDVFQLADATLAQEKKRAARILYGLKNEEHDPNLILWAFTRDIRILLQATTTQPDHPTRALTQYGVLEKRKSYFAKALQHYPTANHWQARLQQAHAIDKINKGITPGNAWQQLLDLALSLPDTNI